MEIVDSKYEILLSFILDTTCKQYIVYTDNTYNEKNELNIYAVIYNPFDDTKLEKVESENEMQIVKSQIKKLLKKEI